MPRLARVVLVLVLVLVLWSATAFAGPRGRVIRVERTVGTNVAPRLCDLRGDTGTCVGEQPKVGETVVLLDEHHVVAEFQIIETTSFVTRCANVWTVKTRAPRGTVTGDGIGVIDANLDLRRAHLLDKARLPVGPSGLPGEEVWRAIDRDGDGTADTMITRYSCDTSGKPQAGVTTHCFEVWARLGNRLTRTTQINPAQCNL